MRRCVLILLCPTLAACLPPTGLDTANIPLGDSALDDSGDDADTADTSDTSDTDDTSDPIDADGDGSPDAEDCDDVSAGVFPGAPELFNGVDDNCDGQVSGTIDEFASVPNQPSGFFGTAVLFARGVDGSTGQEFFSGAVPSVGGAVVANSASLRDGTFDSESALFGLTTDDSSAGLGYAQLLVDLDSDTELDWAIGAPGANGGDGALYLVEDSALSTRDAIDLDEAPPSTLHSLVPSPGIGTSVGGSVVKMGDILAAGASGLVGGGVWLHSTPALLATSTTIVSDGQHIEGGVGDLGLGAALETADFLCMGRPGLLIGAPLATGGATNSGKAYGVTDTTLSTGSDVSTGDADLEVNGGLKDAYLGGILFNAGDVDGDGCDDWWVGSYAMEGETRTLALMLGTATADRLSVATQAHAVIDGIAQFDDFNIASSAIVDVDGDNRKDLVVGQPANSPGELHLFMADRLRDGGALEFEVATDFATGTRSDDLFGAGVIGIDDGGGDGLIVGAPGLNTLYYLPTH